VSSIDWRKTEEIAQSAANSRNAFLVGLGERKERGRRIIQVFVDTDEGITIAQCAEISREMAGALDVQNVINEPYELEVSSPGTDKPLKLLRQYKKNIGRKFTVQYRQDDQRQNLSGTLSSVEGEQLTFTTDENKTMIVEFSNIIGSKEELPW